MVLLGKKFYKFYYLCFLPMLTLSYIGGDQIDPPQMIIVHQSALNALNWLIFHDSVPFNIRKVLGRPFLGICFEISKKFYVDNFFHIQYKGGDPSICLTINVFLGPFWGQKW